MKTLHLLPGRAVLVLILGAATASCVRNGGEAADAEASPTPEITAAPLISQKIEDVVSVFGTVQADPAGLKTIAAPKALIIERVLVRPGQTVGRGQAVIEAVGAPAANLAFAQANDAVRFATSELDRVRRLYDERLAATDQLNAAEKALADAQSTLKAQEQQAGPPGHLTLTAPDAGVVTSVSAVAGDHAAQDAALVIVSAIGNSSVRLGLEPTLSSFAPGQPVTLYPVNGGSAISARVGMIGRAADPATKTLDAIVPLANASLPLGSAVRGDVVTGVHTGLVAPRGAVVFDETGAHIFVVKAGKAQRVFITPGRELGDRIEIGGPIASGAEVAVDGALELQDGMAVKVRGR